MRMDEDDEHPVRDEDDGHLVRDEDDGHLVREEDDEHPVRDEDDGHPVRDEDDGHLVRDAQQLEWVGLRAMGGGRGGGSKGQRSRWTGGRGARIASSVQSDQSHLHIVPVQANHVLVLRHGLRAGWPHVATGDVEAAERRLLLLPCGFAHMQMASTGVGARVQAHAVVCQGGGRMWQANALRQGVARCGLVPEDGTGSGRPARRWDRVRTSGHRVGVGPDVQPEGGSGSGRPARGWEWVRTSSQRVGVGPDVQPEGGTGLGRREAKARSVIRGCGASRCGPTLRAGQEAARVHCHDVWLLPDGHVLGCAFDTTPAQVRTPCLDLVAEVVRMPHRCIPAEKGGSGGSTRVAAPLSTRPCDGEPILQKWSGFRV
eukprot:364976-Chlamydomonas_euryale.AAC.15